MVATVELIGGALDGTRIPVPDILICGSLPSILTLQGPVAKVDLRYIRIDAYDDSNDILYGFLDYGRKPDASQHPPSP